MNALTHKVVLVVGGSTGIGLAIAEAMAREGAVVVIAARTEAALQSAVENSDAPLLHKACDVTDRDSIARALQQFADASGGRLDVLVNNAGVLSSGPFAELDAADHQRMIDVNVHGLTEMAQLAFPMLRDTPSSVLIKVLPMFSAAVSYILPASISSSIMECGALNACIAATHRDC